MIFGFQNSFGQVNDSIRSTSISQVKDSINRASINIDLNGSKAFYFSPCFSYRFSSHEIEAGPLFRHTRYNAPGIFKLSGFDLGYFYYPNHFGKNFDFYFCFDNKFMKCRARELLDSDNTWEQDSEFDALIYQFSFGYGFKKIFCKRFFISTDIGLGKEYQKSFTTDIYTDIVNPLKSQVLVQARVKLGFYIK
jgi:hypothetical protein